MILKRICVHFSVHELLSFSIGIFLCFRAAPPYLFFVLRHPMHIIKVIPAVSSTTQKNYKDFHTKFSTLSNSEPATD